MPLSLDQYATYLDTRGLPWPAPPAAGPAQGPPARRAARGRPAVLWTVYGTLLAIPEGELNSSSRTTS